MRFKLLLTALLLGFFAQSALAQLEPFKDYDVSDELWNITFIKVAPNMGDDYLEGLKETWVASNKVAKELGQIEDFAIYRSQLASSGDVNQDRTREITKDYPAMREITGEYLVREITVK